MFSPPLYAVLKFPLNYIVSHNYNFKLSESEATQYKVLQGDNMMFRQIRMISDNYDKFQKFVVFVDATGGQNKKDAIRHLVKSGFKLNGRTFIFSERSASMVRQGMFSFVEKHIEPELRRRIDMELDFSKTPTVLSKYYAYRGLMLSSCHCLENWFPKFVVVDDFYRIVKDQNIKYVYDDIIEFTDKAGNARQWKQKAVGSKKQDVEVNCFDGAGICHPKIMREFEQRIGTKEKMNSLILRAPYIKGCIHEIDYPTFYAERGITKITDIWGQEHSVTQDSEPLIIITLSMYKGFKYFKKDGTSKDWDRYWDLFKKFHHCLGVAKWNFTLEQEPLETRCNYQLLQDLRELPFDEFKHLADPSVKWYENIVGGDIYSTYNFLGLKADNCMPLNHYVASIARNPAMLKEPCVKDYLHSLLEKYKDEMKCGRLWMDATFKFFCPDLIALMEHIAALPVVGCLNAGEFYSFDRRGEILGHRLIERNPHIYCSEHNPCIGISNALTKKYLSHLQNVLCISSYDISCQRLNGADFDGDIVLVINNPLMMSGISKDISIVMDVEDKCTALATPDTLENKVDCIIRGLKSLIGEISNMATSYHNKVPKNEYYQKLFDDNVALLSVCNGKAIDYSKTGVLYPIPRNVVSLAKGKYSVPYFMKYAGPYYARIHDLSKAHSNMNLLCMNLERWERGVRWHKDMNSFDWHIMYDEEIGYDQEVFNEIEKLFLEFNKERKQALEFEKKCKNWKLYHKEIESKISKEDAKTYETNWQAIYNVYRNKCKIVCPDVRELANILVILCYEKYPNKFKKFLWHMAGAGVVENIKPVEVQLPIRDPDGEYEYLGQRYSLADPKKYEARVTQR